MHKSECYGYELSTPHSLELCFNHTSLQGNVFSCKIDCWTSYGIFILYGLEKRHCIGQATPCLLLHEPLRKMHWMIIIHYSVLCQHIELNNLSLFESVVVVWLVFWFKKNNLPLKKKFLSYMFSSYWISIIEY